MNIILKGARQIGLDEDYIRKLEATPTYQPSEDILELRQKRPKPEDLPPITVDELASHNSKGFYFASKL